MTEANNGVTGDQAPHQAPGTPGWQILLDAARKVTTDNPDREKLNWLGINLMTRANEHIPADHLMEVAAQIVTTASILGRCVWPEEPVEFLDAQLGKEGLAKLLEGSDYVIYDYVFGSGYFCEGPGYHVKNKNSPNSDIVLFLYSRIGFVQAVRGGAASSVISSRGVSRPILDLLNR